MKTKNKAKTTSVSNATTSTTSAGHLAANKMLVDIDGLSVVVGSESILSDVSLCIHKGEFVGLIGPNGAGKTTLLRTMLGLLKPTKGQIRMPKKSIGYIPQRGAMHDSQVPISVLEVVMLGTQGNQSKARECLQMVGLDSVIHKRFSTLSGGQQQRVLIAKALAGNPDLLVLDEPTTGIDEQSQTDFYDTLHTLQQQGLTIIMVSHDVDAVLRLVTRVICLNRTILYDGPAEHFEADKYLPAFYKNQHRLLHHHHGGGRA